MYSQALKIDDQDDHSEGNTGTPQNIAYDGDPKSMLVIGQYFSDNAAQGGGNNGSYYWEKPSCGHC